MIFGIAIPMMFPITLIALINLYLFDKATLIYFNRAPPKYDDKLSNRAYSILIGAPFAGLLFNYWVLGNPSIFGNPHLFMQYCFEIYNPQHHYFNLKNATYPALMIFVVFIFSLLYYQFIKLFNILNPKWQTKKNKLQKRQLKIEPFLNSIIGYDQLRWYSKLVHKQKTLGILQQNTLLEKL